MLAQNTEHSDSGKVTETRPESAGMVWLMPEDVYGKAGTLEALRWGRRVHVRSGVIERVGRLLVQTRLLGVTRHQGRFD